MLASFTVRRNFCKLVVSLHVDCASKTAEALVTYGGRIVYQGWSQPYDAVSTPEKAEAFLSRPVGQHATFVEHLEFTYRRQSAA
mgnify:CR=1 FL=1